MDDRSLTFASGPAAVAPHAHERICSDLMVLRLRIGSKDDPAGKWRSGHRLLSLLYSVSLHGGLLAFAFLGPEWSAPDPTVYRSTIVALEKEHKVIYYDFRKELPEVSAANPSSKITTPTPNELKSKPTLNASHTRSASARPELSRHAPAG